MAGYIDSFLVTLRRILGDHAEHHMYEWEEKQKLTFKPLELLRGMHFENSVVILDEAQNTSPHELLTLMSRVDDTSQLIVMGDALQIDTQERFADTGLGTIIGSDAFLDSDYSAFIKLKTQYRGVLADLAINVLQELSPNDDDHVKKVLYTPTL
jgi:predicted ribonuclease YlaK